MKTTNYTTIRNRLSIPVLFGLSILLLPLTPYSNAQEDEEEIFELEAFNVSGSFAGSLAAAAQKKRYAPVIVEALAAEDFGKLPDSSIAESLARLPGLTSQRVNGRSQVISIRGFPADFSTGLVNGREIATTSSNRNIEFDQFPSELLNGAIVYKTADSTLSEQGIGGTIDLRTIRPLSQDKRTVAFNTFYEWTELGKLNAGSKSGGLRYSGTYIDQLEDGKTGIAFGYSHADKPGQGEQWNAWGYPTVDTDEYGEVAILGGAKPFVRSSQLERDSFMAVLENQPNENIHSTFDVFYSDFQETQMLRGIEIPLFWSSAQFRDGSETVDNGLLTKGVFDNVYGVVRNDIVFRDANMFAIGWNMEFANLGEWTAETDLSYSKVNRLDRVLETYSGTGSNQSGPPDSIAYSVESGTGAVFTPAIDYTDTNILKLSGPQGWGGDIISGGQVGYLKDPETDDSIKQFRVSAKRDINSNFISRIEFGANYKNRTKSEFEAGNFLGLPNGQVEAPFPNSIGTTDLSFIGIPGMASYNPLDLLEDGTYSIIVNPNADVLAVDWNVKEEIHGVYTQLGLNFRVGDIDASGNVGLQYIHTNQSSTGLAASGTGDAVTSSQVQDEHSYDNILPSLNLNFAIGNRQNLRFSVARQLMRQRMQDMRAGFQFGYNESRATSTDPFNSAWSGSGGNTQLEPWEANAIDLSFENYFKDGMGYWALAGFYKDLRTFTYTENQLTDFTGFPFTGTTPPSIFEGTLDVPQNGSGGSIKGLEFTLSIPGELISDNLSGLGAILSTSYTDNAIQPDQNNPDVPLQGFSARVASATLYYEKNGFSGRISSRYRSDYRANISTFGPRSEDFRTVEPESLIDAQLSYNFTSGVMEGASIILQGYNLNDEPLSTYEGTDTRLVRDYQRYGRSYSVGMSYKY